MSELLLAYCGLKCGECPLYLATQSDDTAKLVEIIQQWSLEVEDPNMARCNGCKSDGPHLSFCRECGVRLCAQERGVVTCAHCADYGCATLQTHFEHIPDAKTWLEEIRATL